MPPESHQNANSPCPLFMTISAYSSLSNFYSFLPPMSITVPSVDASTKRLALRVDHNSVLHDHCH